mmetsp:Transcript_15995/g.37712  ORF Transcript_15995/g.37712 Transcript_15995/m.37712 type:complete len:440 (+) Transcript_15995:36-1355(+)
MAPVEGSQSAEEHKQRGNEFLKAGKLPEAIHEYTEAIKADASVAVYWSNRSAARLRVADYEASLTDAEEASRLEPKWAKGHMRRAKALEALSRHAEAAQACAEGISVADGNEAKELRRLRAELFEQAVCSELSGHWKGKVSQTLGGYDQKMLFKGDGKLVCWVYDQELDGTYAVKDVETEQDGAYRGGLDVKLGETFVPYLFKLAAAGGKDLHMCCPMTRAERPRTFDGPGYMCMARIGESASSKPTAAAKALSEGEKLIQCLDELAEVVHAQVQVQASASNPAAAEMAEELEELGEGKGTLLASQIQGPESLEDKAQRMASSQRLAALEVKYDKGTLDLAQALMDGTQSLDGGGSDARFSVDEAAEIRRRLRSLGVNVSRSAPTAATPAEQQVQEQQPAQQSQPELQAPPQHKSQSRPAASCFSGCFPWFSQGESASR